MSRATDALHTAAPCESRCLLGTADVMLNDSDKDHAQHSSQLHDKGKERLGHWTLPLDCAREDRDKAKVEKTASSEC